MNGDPGEGVETSWLAVGSGRSFILSIFLDSRVLPVPAIELLSQFLVPQTASDKMTLNGGSGAGGSRSAGRERDRRRGSTPWGPAPPLHRRSMPVDERDLQAALTPGSLAATAAGTRTQGQRLDWPEGSSDSLSSGDSGSEDGVYKVLLLGAPGVGKSALARIFGGIEDGPEAEAAGERTGLFRLDGWEAVELD